MKTIKYFGIIISAAMLFVACSKDDSLNDMSLNEENSTINSVEMPYGFYSILENNSIAPGVNTRENLFFYDEKSFEDWKQQYNIDDEFIQKNIVRHRNRYGYVYVNTTSLSVLDIYKWNSEPGRFSFSGKIINDKRYDGIYYQFKFNVTAVADNIYKLTFVGDANPVFMDEDNFTVKYIGNIEMRY